MTWRPVAPNNTCPHVITLVWTSHWSNTPGLDRRPFPVHSAPDSQSHALAPITTVLYNGMKRGFFVVSGKLLKRNVDGASSVSTQSLTVLLTRCSLTLSEHILCPGWEQTLSARKKKKLQWGRETWRQKNTQASATCFTFLCGQRVCSRHRRQSLCLYLTYLYFNDLFTFQTHWPQLFLHIYLYIYVCTYIYTEEHINIHIYVHTYLYIYMSISVHICIFICSSAAFSLFFGASHVTWLHRFLSFFLQRVNINLMISFITDVHFYTEQSLYGKQGTLLPDPRSPVSVSVSPPRWLSPSENVSHFIIKKQKKNNTVLLRMRFFYGDQNRRHRHLDRDRQTDGQIHLDSPLKIKTNRWTVGLRQWQTDSWTVS